MVTDVPCVKMLTWNRPKQLNALTLGMIRRAQPLIESWDEPDNVVARCILFEGAGGKAFCAGGDIKSLYDNAKPGSDDSSREETYRFFREEYQLNGLIGHCRTPVVSVLNGHVMGGGVGLSVHGTFRVATEDSIFAMPEVAIGLFPDVGGSYFLPRLPMAGVGRYLALTGARLRGAELVAAGVATHLVPTQRVEMLKQRLGVCLNYVDEPREWEEQVAVAIDEYDDTPAEPDVQALLAEHAAAEGKSSVLEHAPEIAACFGDCGDDRSLAEIIDAVDEAAGKGADWAARASKAMKRASPLSMHVTHRQLREGARKGTLRECLNMEYGIARTMMSGQDFFEGVRALLVDKVRQRSVRRRRSRR